MKSSLRSKLAVTDWVSHLPMVKLGLQRVERAVSGFSWPPHHHVISPPQPQPLLSAEFVFVRDDAFKPPLAPLYRGPYKVLKHCEKFFVLQVGDKSDSVSVDRLKPVFPSVPVTHAVPASVTKSPVPVRLQKMKVPFFVPGPARQLHWNPRRTI